jgi:hypothetical protein
VQISDSSGVKCNFLFFFFFFFFFFYNVVNNLPMAPMKVRILPDQVNYLCIIFSSFLSTSH